LVNDILIKLVQISILLNIKYQTVQVLLFHLLRILTYRSFELDCFDRRISAISRSSDMKDTQSILSNGIIFYPAFEV